MCKYQINVRGGINALEVGDSLTIPRIEKKISYVRNAASVVAGDTGKKFSVSAKTDMIVVTRIA